MAYPRLDVGGMDFTVTKWNTLVTMLEDMGVLLIGRGIVSGLALAHTTGLSVSVSDGYLNSRSVVGLTGISAFSCPDNATSYLWVDEDGVVTSTTSTTYPGGNVVCLGKVVTSGGSVTEITEDNRQWISVPLQSAQQVGGYTTVALTNVNVTLSETQYQSRVIKFTGTLTGNVNVIVPSLAGCEWTFVDATTGAYAITVKTASGSGIALTHTKTCKLWTDGTDVLRSTADV